MRPLIIYHGNCADGFTAAWAAWRVFADGADYYPGVYQQPPPDVTGRDVYIVDFSYKRPVLEQMAQQAKSLVILDHHKTAAEDLAGFPGATFDMEKSGARLSWEYFHKGQPVPYLVQVVEDRDLWRFALPHTREIQAVIFSYEYTWENWERLHDDLTTDSGRAVIVQQGLAIERKHFKDVRELTEVCKRRMVIGGVEVWAASLPYTLTSDAGHLMCENGEPFAACYWDTPDGRVFSLRSRDDGMDVSDIAKRYGGGGHKHASGFKLPHGVEP